MEHLSVAVFGLDVVGEGLGLLELLVVVVMVVILGTDVVHLVDGAALGAALNGAVLGHLCISVSIIEIHGWSGTISIGGRGKSYANPEGGVRVGRETSATSELLLASRADQNGVLHRAKSAGIEGLHVEDVDALHLSENLETLKTGGLFEIGRDGTGSGTGTEEVPLALDLCLHVSCLHILYRVDRFWCQFVIWK
jgi:hypothetical protein